MPTETVTVAYVNDPKPGKKYGSIKTTDGIYYSVEPDRLSLFKEGATYEIDYTTNGTYRNFKSMVGAAPTNSAATANISGSKSVEIFVCGAINNVLHGSGTMPDLETLTQWVRDARLAWRDGFGSDDSVPY